MHIKNLERQISKSSIQICLSPSPVQLLSLSLSSAVGLSSGWHFLAGFDDSEKHNFSIHVLRYGTGYRLMETNQMPEGEVTHLPGLNRRTSVESSSILVYCQHMFQTIKLSSSSVFWKQHMNQH